ncbi:hypothetical protein, partial [Eggerthella lenta]|uniref:hypothetical protein n=1 Tax=Eggerthella lenta TaxID=84112 RepID=UPI00232AEC62
RFGIRIYMIYARLEVKFLPTRIQFTLMRHTDTSHLVRTPFLRKGTLDELAFPQERCYER